MILERFFALSAALSAGCSPSPAERGPSAATAVVVPPEPAPESAPEPTPLEPAQAEPDAGTDGSAEAAGDGTSDSLPAILGSLGPTPVLDQIRAAAPRLRRCYQSELATDPDFEAKLVVELVIRSGKVATVRFPTSSTSHQMDACVEQALKTLSFPIAPDGGDTVVKLPLVFARG
jgi:outer membrane biosynthesis protein TonB